MGADSWKKFQLLMWKNFTLQKRHIMQTVVEIMAPVIFATLMVLVRSLVEPVMEPVREFKPFNATEIINETLISLPADPEMSMAVPSIPHLKLSYSPESPMAEKLINNSAKYLIVANYPNLKYIIDIIFPKIVKVVGYENAKALERRLVDPISNDTSLCGIQFDDNIKDLTEWPVDSKVTLRFPAQLRRSMPPAPFFNWRTNLLYPMYQPPGPRSPDSIYGGWPGYVSEGFSPLAHALMREITKTISKKTNESFTFPDIEIQRFPHPPYLRDDLLPALQKFISIIIMLSFQYTCINTVKVIAAEKEHQLKEVMKIMGLPNWLHWTAWFVKTFSYLLIAVVLIVVLLKVEWYKTKNEISGYSVFTNTPWHIVFVFMMVYITTTICFCFMISVFFSKANTAATVAGLMFFLSYTPYMFMNNDRTIPSRQARIFASFASNTAMAYGFEILLAHESTGEGLQWNKLFTPLSVEDSFVMGDVFVLLIADAFIYMLITLYVEQIFPGSYGVARPWYFPFTGKFWRSACRNTAVVESISQISNTDSEESIEPDPINLKIGIKIINLTKVFKKKVAVDNLNLKIFQSQITVLLGHNGAGKTTTMSMLTGMFPPTTGTAMVAGFDIRTDMNKVRASLGICPQHNILFSDLTVAEHIYFYASLKGMKGELLKDEVDKYVSLLDLDNKKNALAHALSGGMKRKLNVGIALCGQSKVVLLDEPSSGMDPSARRHMWDLLHKEKRDRTVILTTHFMDEAEILGERVAIMSAGKLCAVGSPFYLKKKFGQGYRLVAARKPMLFGQLPSPAAPVTELIKSYIPETKLNSDIGSELSYILPEELSSQYEPMLKELEKKHDELGLAGFGISAATLEEVFMRIGADAIEETDENDQIVYKELDANGDVLTNGDKLSNGNHLMNSNHEMEKSVNMNDEYYTGIRLGFEQWKIMLYKKLLTNSRTWILSLLQFVIPVLFLIIVILVIRMWKATDDLPSRDLQLHNGYQDSLTFINNEDNLDSFAQAVKKAYISYFDPKKYEKMNYEDIETNNISQHYLEEAEKDFPKMRRRNLIGSTIGNEKTKVWFSNFGYHDLPASLLLLHTSILKAIAPDHSISLINYPLPFSLSNKIEQLQYGDNAGFQIAFNLGFSMAFVTSFYVLFYIKENTCRAKLLQYASGASPALLWGAAAVWDMLIFCGIGIALCITLAVAQQTNFATFNEIGRIFILLMVFGWAALPMHYIAALFFHTPSTGYSRMCLFNIFTGVAMFLVTQILQAPGLDLEHVGKALHWVFLIFPHYALCAGINNLYDASVRLDVCHLVCEFQSIPNCTLQKLCDFNPIKFRSCCLSEYPFFEWEDPGIGAHITYLVLIGFILFLCFLAYEYKLHTLICKPRHSPPAPLQHEEEDSDVTAERNQIHQLPSNQFHLYNLLTKDLSKYYGKFLAVNQLSIAVKDNECFGLLGINGAGKTTTFKMLTGDLRASSGNAWINGMSINNDMKSVYKSIGYCPQFDALLDDLTGRETLHIYARLRGIKPELENKYVWDLSRRLGFIKHLDKRVGEYSGGNKRKLSTSLALLGNPSVVYLDEPTSGMDPMAKRQVWRAVSNHGCVILTSHSMEECEALCTRLIIMVNGRPKCLGSPQHLKNKFSQGYTLTIKMRRKLLPVSPPDIVTEPATEDRNSPGGIFRYKSFSRNDSTYTLKMFDFDRIQAFISDKFPEAVVKESYQGLITYHLPNTDLMWSEIFGIMESAKDELNIEDYSIGQTSLEQIFLQFTKDQTDDERN